VPVGQTKENKKKIKQQWHIAGIKKKRNSGILLWLRYNYFVNNIYTQFNIPGLS
jgi:hypothetical protein